jgi:hypothetical protein
MKQDPSVVIDQAPQAPGPKPIPRTIMSGEIIPILATSSAELPSVVAVIRFGKYHQDLAPDNFHVLRVKPETSKNA